MMSMIQQQCMNHWCDDAAAGKLEQQATSQTELTAYEMLPQLLP